MKFLKIIVSSAQESFETITKQFKYLPIFYLSIYSTVPKEFEAAIYLADSVWTV